MEKTVSRRWVLRGLGGATLAIPALPSLLSPRTAQAAAGGGQIFVGVMSAFGGCWGKKMFPQMPSSAEVATFAGKKVRRAPIKGEVNGGTMVLSDVLQAPSTLLTAALVEKMSLLQGLDMPLGVNHHAAATFGNLAQGDGDVRKKGGEPRATIDQVIAQSPAFYKTLDGVTQRSVYLAHFGELSFRRKAGAPASQVEKLPALMNPEAVWNALFGSAGNVGPMAPTRPSIVDLVHEDYRRLRDNPRLAALDKERLEDDVARIDDIKRRLSVKVDCAKPDKPGKIFNPGDFCGDAGKHADFYQAFQDVVVAGLACGLTRVVTQLHTGWTTTFGERCKDPWHQEISHKVDDAGPQASMCASMRRQFADVVVPLAAKLDAVKDANGQSLLDRTLLYWTQEHGTFSHAMESIPVVTFGSAAGAFRTGQHIDYRDMSRLITKGQFGSTLVEPVGVGLTWHQMMGTVLRGFGIPHTEWKEPNHGGYGFKPNNQYSDRNQYWGQAEWGAAGEDLPFWRA